MLLKKYSPVSCKYNELEVPISEKEYRSWLCSGKFVEDYFPNMPSSLCEFLVSGITPQEWKDSVGDPG